MGKQHSLRDIGGPSAKMASKPSASFNLEDMEPGGMDHVQVGKRVHFKGHGNVVHHSTEYGHSLRVEPNHLEFSADGEGTGDAGPASSPAPVKPVKGGGLASAVGSMPGRPKRAPGV